MSVKYKTIHVGDVSFKMIHIEGGTFSMGGNHIDSSANEKPIHTVQLSNFCIGETVVTQELWKIVTGKNPSFFKGDKLPVENVSWCDCDNFIKKLNQLTGEKFRLPTEAEWEYAASGGLGGNYQLFSGSDNYDDVAWCVENSNGTTHPVALKKPNCFGLYDMSGNVYEWCLDYFDMYKMDNYYCKTQVNPVCTSSKQERLSRIVRGGSYYSCSNRSRVSYRTSYTWGTTYSFIGLRLASSSLKK